MLATSVPLTKLLSAHCPALPCSVSGLHTVSVSDCLRTCAALRVHRPTASCSLDTHAASLANQHPGTASASAAAAMCGILLWASLWAHSLTRGRCRIRGQCSTLGEPGAGPQAPPSVLASHGAHSHTQGWHTRLHHIHRGGTPRHWHACHLAALGPSTYSKVCATHSVYATIASFSCCSAMSSCSAV